MAIDMNDQEEPFSSPTTGATDALENGGTVVASIKPGYTKGRMLTGMRSNGSYAWRFGITNDGSGDVKIDFRQSMGTFGGIWRSDDIIPYDTWSTVAVTYDSLDATTAPRMWLNGVEITVFEPFSPSGTVLLATGDVVIGDDFLGLVEGCYLFDRVLTDGELSDITFSTKHVIGGLVRRHPLGPLNIATAYTSADDASPERQNAPIDVGITIFEETSPYVPRY